MEYSTTTSTVSGSTLARCMATRPAATAMFEAVSLPSPLLMGTFLMPSLVATSELKLALSSSNSSSTVRLCAGRWQATARIPTESFIRFIERAEILPENDVKMQDFSCTSFAAA